MLIIALYLILQQEFESRIEEIILRTQCKYTDTKTLFEPIAIRFGRKTEILLNSPKEEIAKFVTNNIHKLNM